MGKHAFYIPPEIVRLWRSLLTDAQNDFCPICGIYLYGGGSLNIDHVIPRDRGGKNELGNVFIVHMVCNHRKANRMPTGCELIWLMAVNARIGYGPQRW